MTSVDAGVSLLASRVAVDGSLPQGALGALGLTNSRWRVSGRRSCFDVLAKPWTEFPYDLTDLEGAFEVWTGGAIASGSPRTRAGTSWTCRTWVTIRYRSAGRGGTTPWEVPGRIR